MSYYSVEEFEEMYGVKIPDRDKNILKGLNYMMLVLVLVSIFGVIISLITDTI